ncbi:MAG: hypothetical protein E6Q32_06485 [Neisseriales bacterium]|nr:MAG: hypothetical protein E6Q32_06485 [Neisseriales bacterium]
MTKHILNNSSLGYVWQNEFCLHEKALLIGFLFRIFVEYLSFFVLLGDHHSIAKALFNTTRWYPATFYFELLFTLIFSFGILFLGGVLYFGLRVNPRSLIGKIAFIIPSLFLIFFHIVLHLQIITLPWVYLFAGFTFLFVIAFALEKCIMLHSLIRIVKSKLQFYMLIKLMFLIIVFSLIGATFLHKLTMIFTMSDNSYQTNEFGNMSHPSTYQVMFMPLLILNIITAIIEVCLSRYKKCVSSGTATEIWLNLTFHFHHVLARAGIGILIGAFLVEWYFILPILLQSTLNIPPDKISSMILVASIVSLIANLVIARFLSNIDIKKLFIGMLIAFILAIIFVSYNLYYKHMIFLSVLVIALFYNSIQATTNKLIHYEIMSLTTSLIFLIIGTEFSLIWSGFLSSGISIFLADKLSNAHHIFVIPIVLALFICINLFSYYHLRIKNQSN